jgi:drug/metabolite transporter (DMT)-like permease
MTSRSIATLPVGAMPGIDARRAGFLLIAASALAFSTAGLFTRLITTDVWTMLFWRGLFGGLFIAGYIVWRHREDTPRAFGSIGWPGVIAGSFSTIATICFVNALRRTTVADVTIIFATAPFIAALVAWLWIRERQNPATLAASALALVGVVVMFRSAVSVGHLAGDLLAVAMTVLMASMMVIIRKNRHISMIPASCLSALACAAAVLPLAHPGDVMPRDLFWLALFGTTQFGLGLLLLTIGSRLISATQASLLSNLELPFAPLWVWLAFGEYPPLLTCVGGAIVLGAVLLDLGADQRRARRTAG